MTETNTQVERKERQTSVLSNGVRVEYPKGKRRTKGRVMALTVATTEISKAFHPVYKIHLNEDFHSDLFYNMVVLFKRNGDTFV